MHFEGRELCQKYFASLLLIAPENVLFQPKIFFFLISAGKHMLGVLISSASKSTSCEHHNICFCGEIRKKYFPDASLIWSCVSGMANSVDPDQTALKEQSNLGLHCLPMSFCLILW